MIRSAVIWVCIAGTFAIGLITRLQHPDLTETRLFLEFWPRWIAAGGLSVFTVWLMSTKRG